MDFLAKNKRILRHNITSMPFRLILPLFLSLLLHASLFSIMPPKTAAHTAHAPVQATLRPPPNIKERPETPEHDPLLKNTLAEETPKKAPKEPPKPPPKPHFPTSPTKETGSTRELNATKQKLSNYIFYPEVAVRNGWEGIVELYVELSPNGAVEEVRIVRSSGYPVLDNAAIKGFYAVGHLPGASAIWSYQFRLEN